MNDIKIVREPGVEARPSTAPGLGVCEWSPEGLHDKSVSLIPNTDKIIKFVKKKSMNRTPLCRHPGLELSKALVEVGIKKNMRGGLHLV